MIYKNSLSEYMKREAEIQKTCRRCGCKNIKLNEDRECSQCQKKSKIKKPIVRMVLFA
jgi:hypothetical protein